MRKEVRDNIHLEIYSERIILGVKLSPLKRLSVCNS